MRNYNFVIVYAANLTKKEGTLNTHSKFIDVKLYKGDCYFV